MTHKLATLLFLTGATAALQAAPQLRLTTTSLGPILVAQGANGSINSAQLPYATNVGSGTLNLKVASSDTWLVPSVGAASNTCSGGVTCSPINVSLQTSGLSKGVYTGFVTVSDPNAVDAPQTISVTVDVGGNVPDQITLYTAPNGTATTTFNAGNGAGASASTQTGGPWLSVAGSGFGSFVFAITYTVTANAAGLSAGDYNGSIAVSGSSFGGDNKTVPVTLHVTAQPIGQPTSSSVQFQIAQGAAKQTFPIVLVNGGQGTLTVSGATVATSSGGTWLTAAASGNVVTLTADAATLAPGTYKGTVTINSNAVNGASTIPVTLSVAAAAPPATTYTGVVNVFTNSLLEGVSQGDVVAVYGSQFTTGDAQVGNLPLGTTLAGTQVLVNGQAVPIEYVSANQINIQIPYDAQLGSGTLMVVRNGQQGNTASINITKAAPALLPFQGGPYVIAQTATGGFEGYAPSAPAHPGDTLVLYAVGLGATSPQVTAGTAAPTSPLANVTPTPSLCFGLPNPINSMSLCTTPQFAGLTPGFFGLYQINFVVPQNAPTGDAVPLFLQVGESTSNLLQLAIH